ncbi:hypothetical protein AMAG_19280 [Allomyces macrogynus ATCC 38327]|uniref:Uncharacterized protein n=1 Tax=Allomyces macrogynus (strain ATCC 38327) TaxID=578462 RepID=A0A0L0SQK3_ALLM3|nr:hypothetical protein AMAG_19280 [Allomyces macrogynus ATCC 38327]|eukprot:KNE64782.1 hypothetical protein AMAG_19280 [Allomyces macrogynus ATCC 38327]
MVTVAVGLHSSPLLFGLLLLYLPPFLLPLPLLPPFLPPLFGSSGVGVVVAAGGCCGFVGAAPALLTTSLNPAARTCCRTDIPAHLFAFWTVMVATALALNSAADSPPLPPDTGSTCGKIHRNSSLFGSAGSLQNAGCALSPANGLKFFSTPTSCRATLIAWSANPNFLHVVEDCRAFLPEAAALACEHKVCTKGEAQ